jgi:pimeloyl-ACP methyl ester carboxylesterase
MSTFEAELAFNATRLLHFGITYGDFRAAATADAWDEWSRRIEAQAACYQAEAEQSWQAGHRRSALDGWSRSAAYHHFAQLRVTELGRKRELQRRCRDAYARVAPLLTPPAVEVSVPFAGTEVRGYLRTAHAGAPCVLLVNGLDSAKEVELATFAEGFLLRGSSVFYFDGPGQGELAGEMSLSRLESAVTAIIDALSEDWVGPVPFGIFGVSHGGYLACRAAAWDLRLRACISLGGFHDGSVLRRLPPHVITNLRRAYCLVPDAPLDALDEAITLDGLRGQLRCPLLVIHGTADHLVDREQVRRLAAWARPIQAEIWSLEGSEHVCTDRFGECLPWLWDWMAARLATRPEEAALAGIQ